MGYYSTLYVDFKDTEVEPFLVTENTKNHRGEKVDWYGFEGAKVEKDGNIEMGDYYAKFYDAEEFAKLLATKIKKGRIRLHFVGDDGEASGFIVEPSAVVEYFGEDDYSLPYLSKGEELLVRLLQEKKERMLKEIKIIDERMKELASKEKRKD